MTFNFNETKEQHAELMRRFSQWEEGPGKQYPLGSPEFDAAAQEALSKIPGWPGWRRHAREPGETIRWAMVYVSDPALEPYTPEEIAYAKRLMARVKAREAAAPSVSPPAAVSEGER